MLKGLKIKSSKVDKAPIEIKEEKEKVTTDFAKPILNAPKSRLIYNIFL